MKKGLLFTFLLSLFVLSKLLAQMPNLPAKTALSNTLLSSKTITSSTQVDTALRYLSLGSSYTVEVKAKVTAVSGRGIDIEGRNGSLNGFRVSLADTSLRWTTPLSAPLSLSAPVTGQDQVIRVAVQNDSAYIFHNGAYIKSSAITTIKDIANGVETDNFTSVVKGDTNLVPSWAGTATDNNGTPGSYGWAYTGTTSTTLFSTANSTSGVRYVDVNSTSNTHTLNGFTYNGRLLFIRWDASNISGTVYSLPVNLEANTTYNFSMLHAYFSNATGGKSITVGIGKTTAAGDRFATHVFNTSGTKNLVRENFSFTSQEAGVYYLTFTGDWALFSIGELSLNKDLPGSLIPNWAGTVPANTGTPGDYGWGYTGTTSTTLFNTANATSGVRYTDVNASVNTHTYNGSTYNGRLLFLRWDNNAITGTAYNYPVYLDANTTYDFSMLHAYFSNATGNKTMTAGIGKTTAIADRFATHTFVTSGTKSLQREDFYFTSREAGLYYITITGDWALFTVGELALNKIAGGSRLIFGKNYPAGAVNMQITSVTYDEGAYAPTTLVTGGMQNVTITGNVVSRIPATNTNFIVPGKTDFHLTGDYAPFINSTVALNSPDAWLFFDNIKPSVVIASWLGNVTINGAAAANNPNVRVAVYKNGSVVIPNGNVVSTRAMEIFTQPGLGGSTRQLEIETYHDSLGSFDNKICSFILRRGYMATIANNNDGSGYSRVFIANDSDLVMNAMPAGLDTSVSFIRIFKWDWVSKKGWAGGGTPVDMVNATWFYDWNIGGATTNNYNYVMIRQNGGWPSWSAIRAKQGVNSLSGFNEPDQSNQANMTVDQAIAQWPEMMKSGQRIGSPSPANPTSSWIGDFMNKCNTLNYRVDYVTIHCYWNSLSPQGWYNRLKSIYDVVKRPLWITEWNNGANWTGESWPSDQTAQFQKQLSDIKGILQVLDTTSFVERYSIYNWVEDKRAMVLGDTLTPAGKYYAANRSEFAYNAARLYAHEWHLVAPSIDTTVNSNNYYQVSLSFRDVNGELGAKYVLERMIDTRDTGFLAVQEYTGYPVGGLLSFTDSIYSKATYRVKAFNKAGNQFVYSASMIFRRDTVPAAPTSLTGTTLSSTRISLSWNAGANARSYNLKRSTNAAGPFTTVLSYTTSRAYTDTTLAAGTTYYYVVTSLNTAGESSNSTVLSIRTNDLVAPAAVVNPRAASGDTRAILTWDFIYDARYEISRASSPGGTYSVIATNIDAVRYEDNGLSNGTTSYYKIVAFNGAGRSPSTVVLTATPGLGQHLHIAFNEGAGSVAADEWGGYHATLYNSATWAAGKDSASGAVSLTKSSSSYMQLPAGVVSSLNNFTIASWIRIPANQPDNARLFDFGNDVNTFMVLVPKTGTNVRYKIASPAGINDRYIAYQLPKDTWVHVTISQQNNVFKFYVNGQLQYSDSNATIKPSDMGATGQNFLGRSQFANDPYTDHIYDDFRIYNYALSDQNVSSLVNSGSFRMAAIPSVKGEAATSIRIYPNPAGSMVSVSGLAAGRTYNYRLYSMDGRIVAIGNVSGTAIYLPVDLSAGSYLIQLLDKEKIVVTRQLLIQR